MLSARSRTVLTTSSTSIQVVRPILTRALLDSARIVGLSALGLYQRPSKQEPWITTSQQWSRAGSEETLLNQIADRFKDFHEEHREMLKIDGSLRTTTDTAAHECSYEQMRPFLDHLRRLRDEVSKDPRDESRELKRKNAKLLLELCDIFDLDKAEGLWWSHYLATL